MPAQRPVPGSRRHAAGRDHAGTQAQMALHWSHAPSLRPRDGEWLPSGGARQGLDMGQPRSLKHGHAPHESLLQTTHLSCVVSTVTLQQQEQRITPRCGRNILIRRPRQKLEYGRNICSVIDRCGVCQYRMPSHRRSGPRLPQSGQTSRGTETRSDKIGRAHV